MTITTKVWLMALVLLAGCSGTSGNFWRGLTRTLCKYNRDCTEGYDDSSVGECAYGMYSEDADPGEFSDFCPDYDSGIGRRCLAYMRDARHSCLVIDPRPAACEGVCGPGTTIEFGYQQLDGATVPVPRLVLDLPLAEE
jgi:hypothetical protein